MVRYSYLAYTGIFGILSFAGIQAQTADSSKYWFYKPYEYGSMANYNPADVIVNGGFSSGVYYDRNNSLLASMICTSVPHNRFRLNVYPGVLHLGTLSTGFFIAYTGELAMGIGLRYAPMGLGFSTLRSSDLKE
jgi:hypothetical protein